jgi:hypothetical protein
MNKWRILTNIIGIFALVVWIMICVHIYKSTGWAGFLGSICGAIMFVGYKIIKHARSNAQ